MTKVLLDRIWDERNFLLQYCGDLAERLIKGELKIFAFGPGGTGKSTLGLILSGQKSFAEIAGEYDLSSDKEYYGITGKHFVKLVVPPGQEDKIDRHWDDLYNAMSRAKRFGVINFASWGYHSLAKIDLERHQLYKPGMDERTFLELYLSDRREYEESIMSKLTPHIKSAPGRFWMITFNH